MTTRATVAVLVLAVAGCGGGGGGDGGTTTARKGSGLTLDLKGGTNATASACGSSHHYAVFPAARAVRFSGDVRPVPVGRWKVKVKVKACRGGSFVELTKLETVRDKHTGHFTGSIPAEPRGSYFARASLYENGVVKMRSDKRHYNLR